ncbi:unnamed protein product [Gongylonema pulchrum]|uniref:Uncharacterized protein n=1 Tax=Gongylonema pulchrum TaxID=637853 RepID=A0A183DFY3_9BILA|nr:unnamed protein product [Gongylonema pulchrum]
MVIFRIARQKKLRNSMYSRNGTKRCARWVCRRQPSNSSNRFLIKILQQNCLREEIWWYQDTEMLSVAMLPIFREEMLEKSECMAHEAVPSTAPAPASVKKARSGSGDGAKKAAKTAKPNDVKISSNDTQKKVYITVLLLRKTVEASLHPLLAVWRIFAGILL